MDGLKPYAAYKESGLPWLGQVPVHWSVLPHRALFKEVKEREHPAEQMLSVTITRGVIKQRELLAGSSKKDSSKLDKSAYKLVCPGDIAYNKMRAWQGAIGASNLRGIISPAYVVQRLREAHRPDYFHHLFRTPSFAKEAERWSYGITSDMWSLRPEHFKLIYSPLPPAEEQAAIIRFLDNATNRLDKAIRAKRKIIALLNEQKQAIIHRAVTRGLDPDVPLKDSGIPWLGQMPAHWEAAPLKGLCSIQSGITLGKFFEGGQLRDFPYLRVANVQAGHLALETVKSLRLPLSEAKRATLQIGDVLMTEGGDPDKLGRGCVWNGEVANCLHQNHVFAVRPNRIRLRSYFLAGLLGSGYAKNYFQQTSKQTTNLASTNKTTIGRFRVPLPSINEQDAILEGLESKLQPVASTIGRIEREISLLREYRTRLIADVVTGKLDVREAAARLPEITPDAAEELDSVEADETLEELAEEAA